MLNSEKILLDATILNRIGYSAFRATLSNGHIFIAHPPQGANSFVNLMEGARVEVCFSPYDFSVARIEHL